MALMLRTWGMAADLWLAGRGLVTCATTIASQKSICCALAARTRNMAERLLVLCVSSASGNIKRRRALRRSWFTTKATDNSRLTSAQQDSIELLFVVSAGDSEALAAEQAEHGDLMLLDAAEGYHNLWRKALISFELLEQRYQYAFYMHADDDSYVRLDLMLQLLSDCPREQFYWGYIWDGSGNRTTQPIRNPRNKSHMPVEQYALDFYPPFASGCGFVLSRDLVQALLRQPLPDYRLLDPPFGIHLCGNDFCVLPGGPIKPVHDERVRPYRGIPIFQASTVVQHYLTPEEMVPFHQQVLQALQQSTPGALPQQQDGSTAAAEAVSRYSSEQQQQQLTPQSRHSAPDDLYAQLVQLGLLRR
ncbi:galactosyltransferase-domain-containing protein [Scenedesmus sp. NREL 46B-D3]|nr:galactosyltransferase-domain-containing protein [Scenedesmus sp. NREL 46B-D3]